MSSSSIRGSRNKSKSSPGDVGPGMSKDMKQFVGFTHSHGGDLTVSQAQATCCIGYSCDQMDWIHLQLRQDLSSLDLLEKIVPCWQSPSIITLSVCTNHRQCHCGGYCRLNKSAMLLWRTLSVCTTHRQCYCGEYCRLDMQTGSDRFSNTAGS